MCTKFIGTCMQIRPSVTFLFTLEAKIYTFVFMEKVYDVKD